MRFAHLILLAFSSAALMLAEDVSGKWSAKVTTQNGDLDLTMNLKADGEKLTGTVSSQMGEMAISNGVIKGDELTWTLVIARDGNEMKLNHKAKVTGSEMKISMTPEGRDAAMMEYTAKKGS